MLFISPTTFVNLMTMMRSSAESMLTFQCFERLSFFCVENIFRVVVFVVQPNRLEIVTREV